MRFYRQCCKAVCRSASGRRTAACGTTIFSTERPDEILLAEQWSSPEQQEIHLRQPHMARLQQLKTTYIAETAVQRL